MVLFILPINPLLIKITPPISNMSMLSPCPSKLLHGDVSLWAASLVMEVQISDGFPNHQISNRQSLKPKEAMPFQKVDILAQQNYTDSRFYIFDPNKFSPSKVKTDLKAARKILQENLVHAGISEGCKFAAHTLESWGNKDKQPYQKYFYLKCSTSILKNTKPPAQQREAIKLASTNNTCRLHGRVNGNRGFHRKTDTSKKMEKTELCRCKPLKVFNNEYCFFVTVPDCSRYHSNHQKESYHEFVLDSSKMSALVKKDRETRMGYATSSAAAQARGAKRLRQHLAPTQQSMANSSQKDMISARSNTDKSHLLGVDDAEARKSDLLKDFYQILNSANLNDPVQYYRIKQSLVELSRVIRTYNESINKFSGIEESDRSLFPHSTSYGDNCRDSKITGRKKST